MLKQQRKNISEFNRGSILCNTNVTVFNLLGYSYTTTTKRRRCKHYLFDNRGWEVVKGGVVTKIFLIVTNKVIRIK